MQPAPDSARASTLAYLAEVLTYMGRFDDAAVAVREGRAIGQRIGDDRAIAYIAWTAAELAAQMRDRDAAIRALDEAERHPAGWFDSLAGIDFLSQASEIRALVGDVEGAWHDLRRAEGRARGTTREGEPLSARVRLEVMHGDAATALSLMDELESSPYVYGIDRWLQPLLRAACHARLGEPDKARKLVRMSRQIASEQGDPDRPARRERELLAIAEPAATQQHDEQVTVVTLGRFAVERGVTDVTPAPGRPSTLVKMLAVRGQLTIDETVDELWPDADMETGKARLRNLLHRIRAESGELVVRTDAAIALSSDAQVDWRRFEADTASALTAPPHSRAGLARAALARATGELLPADRYSEWATVPRERLRRRQLALIDVVSADALARDDFDEAERLLDEAISLDPLDEDRYIRMARALLAQGRVTRAQRVAQQAADVTAELGVEPTAELAALLRELAVS
jgi:DNA-binding SARP family transcriptional activator